MWRLLIFPRMFFVAQGAYFFFFFYSKNFYVQNWSETVSKLGDRVCVTPSFLLWLQPLCPCDVHWQFVKVITRRHHRSVQASSSLYRECGMETEYDCYSIYTKAAISNVNPNTMWLFKALAACVTHPGWGKLLLDLWCVRKHDIMLTSWPPLMTGWEPPPCSNSCKHFC